MSDNYSLIIKNGSCYIDGKFQNIDLALTGNKIKKIGFLTSGGDSPGMNAAIRSVVRSCSYHNVDCFGIQQGFQGLINDDIASLSLFSDRNF